MHDNLKSTNFFFKKIYLQNLLLFALLLFLFLKKLNTNNIKEIKYELIENEY